MGISRCNCPRQDKLHKWWLDQDSGLWYHASCGHLEGPPLFNNTFRTDEDFKNNNPNVRTYTDECIACETKIKQDVAFIDVITMCTPCETLNPEMID